MDKWLMERGCREEMTHKQRVWEYLRNAFLEREKPDMAEQKALKTTIAVLMPVSYYYMTSLNCGGKKARNLGLNSRCHLSNIMPDSIFYESIGWRMFGW